MCVQCAMGAMTAATAATGGRSWLATRSWVGPRLLKAVTAALVGGGVVAAGVLVG